MSVVPTPPMPSPPLSSDSIDQVIARAVTTGALQPITTEQTTVSDGGVSFMIRWISSLACRDAARVAAAGRRDPDFNPFLPPEPDLLIASVGAAHLVLLNKYPVIAQHLLIVTRGFEEQTAALTGADFAALLTVMQTLGGIGFYNGGTEAGASQRHKHLQWIPDRSDGANLTRLTTGLGSDQPARQVTRHPGLPWRHAFVRHGGIPPASPGDTPGADNPLQQAFAIACRQLDLPADRNPMPPYNLIVDRDWMLVVPRSRERYQDISVNALGFAGSLFVRKPAQIELVREIGPLRLLAEVAA